LGPNTSPCEAEQGAWRSRGVLARARPRAEAWASAGERLPRRAFRPSGSLATTARRRSSAERAPPLWRRRASRREAPLARMRAPGLAEWSSPRAQLAGERPTRARGDRRWHLREH